jgi:hypothetical protein
MHTHNSGNANKSKVTVSCETVKSRTFGCLIFIQSIILMTVCSRDLRYKEMTMESMMMLPDDMFRLELLPYLTVYDIVNLDIACISHEYRPQLMEKISGVI